MGGFMSKYRHDAFLSALGGQDPFTFQVELPGLQDHQKLVPKSIYIQ
jgi:hypothetical protein